MIGRCISSVRFRTREFNRRWASWIQARDFSVRYCQQMRLIRAVSRDCLSVLDVGCGPHSVIPEVKVWRRSVGVEGESSRAVAGNLAKTHDRMVQADVTVLSEFFGENSFDLVVALDLIEHLSKEAGHRLIADMERIAAKYVIVATPNGFLPQYNTTYGLEEHLSGWTAEEMRGLGFQVKGIYGPKALRGEYHLIIRQPMFLWVGLSRVLQKLMERPFTACCAGLFCAKSVRG